MLRAILGTTTVLGISAWCGAATIQVAPAGGHYSSIQAAIDAASNGDVIMVSPGTYAEAIDLRGKAVNLRSSNPADPDVIAATVIDATGLNASVVTAKSGEDADTVIDGFTLTGGVGTPRMLEKVGGGVYLYNTDPTMRNCLIVDNHADTGGGMWTLSSNATIENCTFQDNVTTATGHGGAGIYNGLGGPDIVSCSFIDNSSGYAGGGIYNDNSNPAVTNSVFYGNSATFGAGMSNNGCSPVLINCTISANRANTLYASNGGGMKNAMSGTPVLINCIVCGNTPSEVYDSWGVESTVTHSVIGGGWSGNGDANVDADPMFVDPTSGDLRLLVNSPAVDTGDTGALPAGLDCDADGLARIVGNAVDIGAYEMQSAVVPTGGCCLSDGSCILLTESDCAAVSGSYGGDNTDCTSTDCALPCPADLTGNGWVDTDDLLALFGAFGANCNGCVEDVDGDNDVDTDDMLTILQGWGACN